MSQALLFGPIDQLMGTKRVFRAQSLLALSSLGQSSKQTEVCRRINTTKHTKLPSQKASPLTGATETNFAHVFRLQMVSIESAVGI